jgi:hypothetical protein
MSYYDDASEARAEANRRAQVTGDDQYVYQDHSYTLGRDRYRVDRRNLLENCIYRVSGVQALYDALTGDDDERTEPRVDMTSHARRTGYLNGYQYAPEPADFERFKDGCDWGAEIVSGFHEHTMQYSPWEFFAHDLNESSNPDAAWEVFDRGIMAGARRRWREWQTSLDA